MLLLGSVISQVKARCRVADPGPLHWAEDSASSRRPSPAQPRANRVSRYAAVRAHTISSPIPIVVRIWVSGPQDQARDQAGSRQGPGGVQARVQAGSRQGPGGVQDRDQTRVQAALAAWAGFSPEARAPRPQSITPSTISAVGTLTKHKNNLYLRSHVEMLLAH